MNDPLAKYRQNNSQSVTSDPLAKFKPQQPKKVETPKYNPNSYQDALSKSIGIQAPSVQNNSKPPLTTVSNKGGSITFGNQFDRNSSIAGSATAGLLDSLTLGLGSKLMDKLQPGITQQAQQENPAAFQAGKIGGYILPATSGAKAVQLMGLKKVTNPLANRVLEGAIVGGGMTGIEDKVNGKSWGETAKDVGTNMALGGALDLGLYGASKGLSKLFPKKVPNIEPTPITQPKNNILALPAPKEQPIIMGGYKDNNVPLVRIKKELKTSTPMAQRDFNNVGNSSIKAYQQDNPSVRPFIQDEANILKGELERTIPASRGANYVNGNRIGYANQRVASDSVATLKTLTGASYEDLNKAVNNIIKDHGAENNALSKKVELILDDRLSSGYYDDVTGQAIPANADYLINKLQVDESPKFKNTLDYNGIVNKKIAVPTPSSKPQQSINPNIFNGINAMVDNTKVMPQYAREEIHPNINTLYRNTKRIEPLNSSTEPLKPQGNVNIPNTNLNAVEGNLKPSIGATDRTKLGMDIVSSTENKGKQTPKEFINNLYTRLIDINHPIKNIGEGAYIKATNSKNVGGTVDHIITQNLVDRNGNKIGESLKSIVKDVPKNEENDFMNYVLQRHNIDRAREGKAIDPSFTSEQSSKAVKLIEQKHPEYKALNDRLIKFINTFESEWGNKSGLISNDLWNELQQTYKNYVPTQREFSTLEQGMTKTNGKGFVNQGTPLNKATGSDRNIINPIENIMNLVNRTVRTSRYNEVGQELIKAIENNPAALSKYAELIPPKTPINPNVKNVVSVLVNGEPINVQINDKSLLDALQNINKTNVGPIETKLKQGTNIFKSLITQKNPVFAIRNIARDIPTAYINGSESNPIKFIKDLATAGKDLATNSEVAQQYHALGGGGSNFFNSNNTAKNAKELTQTSLLKKIGNGIEKFNNITESAPRLAEFKRTVNKTGDLQKALYNASDITTNFSRGGDITKHLDSAVPYLNAGVQGLDKLARQFVTKPIPTTLKGLIGITAPTIALDMVNKNNPNYQNLDNRTKDNYYLIPNGDTFIKIPKSRELGVLFGSLFERIIRSNQGDKAAFKGFGNTVATNFAPANPLENNIFSPALAIKSNKDFANRAIVPQSMLSDNRSKYLQYDEKTSEITKGIAAEVKKLGVDLSPKQMDYLIKSYTGVIGQLGLPATTKTQGGTFKKITNPITSQFVADPIYSNQTINDFYDNYDKIKTLASDKNILQNIPSKKLTKEEKQKSVFTKASTDISALNKEIRKAQVNNDVEKVKELRMKIIEVANKANQSIK